MVNRVEIFLGIILVTALAIAYWPSKNDSHIVVKYDCSISEISPDYPIAVKEACRKRNQK